MDFLQNATDDQIALMGCFVALFASVALMYLSAYLNRSRRQRDLHNVPGRTLALTSRDDRSVEAKPRKVA